MGLLPLMTIGILSDFHPPSSGDPPQLPDGAPSIHRVDLTCLSRIIKLNLANGASPAGLDGPVTSLLDDAECLEAL